MIPYNYAEEEVYALIKSCCSKEEDAKFMPLNVLQDHKGRTIIPDMFLPNGCRKLNIKPKTCIEIYANLYYDTFSRLKAMYDFIHSHPQLKDFHLMLITTEKVDHLQTVNSGLKGRDIQVVYFNDLLKKVALEKKQKGLLLRLF